jgi:CysZ protein
MEMKLLWTSIEDYRRAWHLARTHRLWSYLWIPGLVSAILGAIFYFLIPVISRSLAGGIVSLYPWEWGSGWIGSIALIFSYLIVISTLLILYRYLILIISFPFMSFLSQKVERILTGRIAGEDRSPVLQFVSEMLRGIGITSVLLSRELLFTVLLLLASWIPGAAILTGPLLFLTHAYYAGCGNADYTLERYHNISRSRKFMKAHRWQMIGNGSVFLLVLSIPIIGIFVAPVWATIAATFSVLEQLGANDRFDAGELV